MPLLSATISETIARVKDGEVVDELDVPTFQPHGDGVLDGGEMHHI